MLGKIVKYYAIAKAPKLAFSVFYPRTAARLGKAQWDLKHALAPRAVGVAVLMIALPVGYALGRISDRRLSMEPLPPSL
jgi:hypothetical protein